jgi:hypothetical protein
MAGVDMIVVQARRVGAVGGRSGRSHIPLLPAHEDEFTQTAKDGTLVWHHSSDDDPDAVIEK